MVMTAGGATAFADTGSAASDGTTTSTQDSARPHGLFSGTLRHTLRDVTSTFGVRGQRLTQLLTDQRGLATKSVLDTVSFGLDATTRITRTVTGVLPAQPPTSPIEAATPSPAGIVPTAAAVVPDVTPVSDPLTTTVDQVAPAPAPVTTTALTTVQGVVDPVTTGVGALPDPMAPVSVIASLPQLTAPIPDFIVSLQNLLTATTDAAAGLATLPSELASLFGLTWTAPVSSGAGTRGPLVAAGSPVASPRQIVQHVSGTPSVTDTTTAVTGPTAASPIDLVAALGRASSESESARVAPNDAVPARFEAFFGAAGGLVAIVAVSLSMLALAALPGAAGLLASVAAGMRIGYRQAKSQMAIRSSGIARFAVGGPVGIVRSGNLVAFRPRTANVARRPANIARRPVARNLSSVA
jgi:hypothetical protein